MISGDYETNVTLNKKDFTDIIDRSILLVREEDRKPIIMNIADNKMELRINSQIGSMDEEIDIEMEGREIMIGFNPKYLIDALRVIDDEKIAELVRKNFELTPGGIIRALDLRRPIYRQTAAYGHFGRTDVDLPWEHTDKAETLREQAGI